MAPHTARRGAFSDVSASGGEPPLDALCGEAARSSSTEPARLSRASMPWWAFYRRTLARTLSHCAAYPILGPNR